MGLGRGRRWLRAAQASDTFAELQFSQADNRLVQTYDIGVNLPEQVVCTCRMAKKSEEVEMVRPEGIALRGMPLRLELV